MANITKLGPQPIKTAASNVSPVTNTVSKRHAIKLMPGVNQTETLTKFFNATVDHLLQPENVEFLSGYIGSKPPYYNSKTDFYIPEPEAVRTDYQLPATAVSVDPASNIVRNVMFYDDILNQLKTQGSNTSNPSRLLEGDYYSWMPPIDPDKFINFYEYYWMPDGPGIIVLLDSTDIMNTASGQVNYTYTGSYYRFADKETINGTLVFTSGMRIRVTDDIDYNLNGRTLIVEGVGRSIEITDDVVFQNPSWDTVGWDTRGWDGQDSIIIPDYMTIERLSVNRNRWSTNNRWFHIDTIRQSGMVSLEDIAVKAQRPIIEFTKNLQLYNFGTYGLPDIDLVDNVRTDFKDSVAGRPQATVDNTNLIDGMKILVTADLDPSVNNRIYQVGGITEYGVITLTLVTTGQSGTGDPTYGDSAYVTFGAQFGGNTMWYNGTAWVIGQSAIRYVPPIFAGFDKDGNNLIDPAVYPGSTFTGTTIFTYSTDPYASIDAELGIQAKKDQFGDFVFDNSLVTASYSYINNGQLTDIYGYIWYRDLLNGDGNSWYKCRNTTRQYIINSYDISTPISTFLIDQLPSTPESGQLPTLYVYYINNSSSTLLISGKDYTQNGRIITLTKPAVAGSRVEIRSWSSGLRSSANGYYQLPINLVENPNNDQPTSVVFNNTINHFSSIISNQYNESSNGIGLTSWRDSPQVRGLGVDILQHSAPLLKLMLLNSNDINTGMLNSISVTDPSLAIQFAQREYVKVYNKFIRTLFTLYATSGYDNTITPQQWISAALKQVNLGKSKVSPWAYSGYEQNEDFSTTASVPTFIPPTAAKLSAGPVYHPQCYLDTDYYPAKLTIQTHDGARIIMEDLEGLQLGTIDYNQPHTSNPELLTHPVAAAWLQFELNLYDGLPRDYKATGATPAFDARRYVPGKWRTTDYTRSEYIDILRPSFSKWVIQSQVDFKANTTYNTNNQFSFNYGSCVDKQGLAVPGHWRGIYVYFYDTDRPHTHPWEMLGFTQQPEWWTAEYGPAPFTRGNTKLWNDLAQGRIRQGSRAGYDSVYTRSGLLDCIPVDDQGELLPPILAGVIVAMPTSLDAQAEWKFGDGAPVEHAWLTSLDWHFVQALVGYLMKPARFIEQAWDPLRTQFSGENDTQQTLYLDTNRRRSSSEFYVHRENPSSISSATIIPNESTLTFFGSWGIQHWISEYLISQNLNVTNYFGSIIRGGQSILAHKFAGFIETDTSLRVMVDSFGQLGYSSQLIPSENIETYLYRSTSSGTFFYSGVIVVKQRNGWKVYGYDGVDPYFTIIPSVMSGPKSTVVIGNQTVIDYKNGSGINEIPYGYIFGTIEEVYDFLVSYGRWLESQGWVFDTVNDDSGKIINWRQSARDFVYWSQGNWSSGNFIAVSPAAAGIKFAKEFGSAQYVSGTIGGTYPVLDKQGIPIEAQNVEVLRQDGEIFVRPVNNQTIFGLRLFMTSIEHVMLLDNVTQFNDLIYDPLYNIYQPRVKVYTYKTNGWTGRLDAPGFFLYQDPTTNQWKMISNFEKTTEDFRNLYNIDQPKNVMKVEGTTGELVVSSSLNHAVTRSDLSDLAKHMVGFQNRQWLETLLVDDTTMFEFYQGFIRQKGAKISLDSMLRSTVIIPDSNESLSYFEEFALRKSRYGASSLNTNIDFILPQAEWVNNPQRVDVFSYYDSSQERDGVIEIVPRDPDIVVPPDNYEGKLFPLRESTNNNFYRDLPTAGYVQLGETTHYVINQDALISLSADLIAADQTLKTGDTVWQFITPDVSWTVWHVAQATSAVVNTSPEYDGVHTIINFVGSHGILAGDIVVTSGFANNDAMNGTYTVSSVTDTTIQLPVTTFIEDTAGLVQVYRKIRFVDKTTLYATTLLGGWTEGDLAFVDNGEAEYQWTVYKRHLNDWEPIRVAANKVEASLLLQSTLYNKYNNSVNVYLEYFDPGKSFIPGSAEKEITFKNVFDPASYNSGDSEVYSIDPDMAWGLSHAGEVWWDLSTTRYIDYEQGEIDYRAANWGKLAPGTTIDIYEWTRSPIPPSEWATYVASGTSLSQYGYDYVPSGIVRNADNPVWTQTTEYDTNGTAKIYYYFWVGHSDMIPTTPGRSLSTNEITNIILNPSSNNVPWYAAISERSLIVANVYTYLNSKNTVMQIVYTNKPNNANDYKEWALIRNGDQYSEIDEQFWSKMRDSLTAYDGLGNIVPDPLLNPLNRYGNLVRPRQSWFVDRLDALSMYVSKVNEQLITANNPLITDTDKSEWYTYFHETEPYPEQAGNWEFKVDDPSKLLLLEEQVSDGDRVLVLPTASTNNLWTIRTWYDTSKEFVVTRQQSYCVPNYWNYVDWYYTGYSSETIPTYTIATSNDLDTVTLKTGQTVKVTDYGSLGWALFGIVDGIQRIVGLENGTIQISDNLWNSDINLDGYDRLTYDSIPFDYNPTIEIGIIFDGVKEGIYASPNSIELNELFFTMINYVLSEQKFVDWIFKTSFITVSGSYEPLTSSQLYKPTTVDYLIDYIEEAKPYRTKLREFISGRSTGEYDNQWRIMDFDKPPYEDDNNIILDPNNSYDANIMMNDSTYSPWWYNYQANPNLIRKLKTQLVFDRVASLPQPAWVSNVDSFGTTARFTLTTTSAANTFVAGQTISVANVIAYGNTLPMFNSFNVVVSEVSGNVVVGAYSGNIGIGSGINGALLHQTYGAADRVLKEYSPGPYLPDPYSPDLISGTDFKGQIFNGVNFNLEPGWGVAPWDFTAGWDADAATFDQYLDVILEGGMPPVYDQFWGNGTRTQFKLTKVPQDLEHTKIWKDHVLCEYGIDYYIPNWATAIEIGMSGKGYHVGDILNLIEDNLQPTTDNISVRVIGVTGTGAITKAEVINKGFYKIIQHSAYQTEYAAYAPGAGTGATLQPVWGGDNLIFEVAPLDSSVPNVWVLYAGTTFEQAPDMGEFDIITDGGAYVQPYVDENHPEELYQTKLRDAIRVDTYTQPVGGRPVVAAKVCLTDGFSDHYSLGLRPQDESAVIAYLDGDLLYYGPLQDYVVNFETGEMVFMLPPAAGKILTTTTIGEGGSGNSVVSVFVKNGGYNYAIGDLITLAGGVPTPISGNPARATVEVTSLKATELDVLSRGSGYKKGETLILLNSAQEEPYITSKVTAIVQDVDRVGQIRTLVIKSSGNYKQVPTTFNWKSTGKGTGAIVNVVWGVNTASVSDSGLYTTKPTEPFTQYSVVSGNGTGATFDALYSSIVNQQTIIADGTTAVFTLDIVPDTASKLLITANGIIVPINTVTINQVTKQVTLDSVPDYGAFMVFTVFNTDQYSVVMDTDVTAQAGVFTYNLVRAAYSTVPNYTTTLVGVDGLILPPPTIDTGISNGYSREFPLTYRPANISRLKVYVDGILQTYLTDYYLENQNVILTYNAPLDAIVVMVVVDPDYGYYYELTDTTITFTDTEEIGFDEIGFDDVFGFDSLSNIIHQGSRISVTNFSQDLAYKFATEQFVGNSSGRYELAGVPTAESTLIVSVNGVTQRILWDYALESVDVEGFDTQGYDLAVFDEGADKRYYVIFSDSIHQNDQDTIIVRYMRGRTERPATAFRQFINSNMNMSSQVLSNGARTTLLAPVYVNSDKLEVADYSVLTRPTLIEPGAVWINNELIQFWEIVPAPSSQHPNRAYLSNILRSVGGTSNGPVSLYDTVFYDGNSSNKYFPTPSSTAQLGETVLLNNLAQLGGNAQWFILTAGQVNLTTTNTILAASTCRVYVQTTPEIELSINFDYVIQSSTQIRLTKTYPADTIIRVELDSTIGARSQYYIGINPPIGDNNLPIPSGRYVVFDNLNIPTNGYRNIVISDLIVDSTNTTLVHVTDSMVQDAGSKMTIPGGYSWKASPYGLQYNESDMAEFIVNHPGTRS